MQQASPSGIADQMSKLCAPPRFYADHLRRRSRVAILSGSVMQSGASGTSLGSVCDGNALSLRSAAQEGNVSLVRTSEFSNMDDEIDTGANIYAISPRNGSALSLRSMAQEQNISPIKTSEDSNSEGETQAGQSVDEERNGEEEDILSSSTSSSSSSSPCSASLPNECKRFVEGQFSITVVTLAGTQLEIKGLYADMNVRELALRIAAETGIPPFAVTLNHDGQLLTIDSLMRLQECSIMDGSELLLVKQWGWAKPDLRLLSELSAKWGGSTLSVKSV